MKRLFYKLRIRPVIAIIASAAITSNVSPARDCSNKMGQSSSQPGITNQITLSVTVVNDRFAYASGLTQPSFTIFDNGIVQSISSFSAEDIPISVGVLLDTSSSMHYFSNNSMKTEFAAFFENSNKANEYFLLSFNARPDLEVDWTRDGSVVASKLVNLKESGPTAFYDACRYGFEKVSQGKYKHALILLTDGIDNASHSSYRQMYETLRNSDVLVYAIAVFRDRGSLQLEGRAILDEFTRVTGGVAFYPTSEEGARRDLEYIAKLLRHQYSIGFRPQVSSGDAKWHAIKVKIDLPATAPQQLKRLRALTRSGYYSGPRKI